MNLFIEISGIILVACLIAEKFSAVRHRRALKHLVHVNGTRGKSTVTRLIAAGLTEGGLKTFCKTTGTLPMTIDVNGNEELIKRRGSANINEQIRTLARAAREGAEVLVIECMAVDPELQYVCENDILHSDVGVITNARVDHVAEMGSTVEEVCRALSNTIPKDGLLFTADKESFGQLEKNARERGSTAFLSQIKGDEPDNEAFPENCALAADVCLALGVPREVALRGMLKVKPDPYTASQTSLKTGAIFINGMSANDPVSTERVLERYTAGLSEGEKVIYILNCRPDRGYRTELMTGMLLDRAKTAEIYLMGEGAAAAERRLKRGGAENVTRFNSAAELPLDKSDAKSVFFAFGNIASQGIKLMERVEKEKKTDVC